MVGLCGVMSATPVQVKVVRNAFDLPATGPKAFPTVPCNIRISFNNAEAKVPGPCNCDCCQCQLDEFNSTCQTPGYRCVCAVDQKSKAKTEKKAEPASEE